MSRGPLTFRQADVTRALRAVKDAGVEVARVEVDKTGKIVVVVGEPDKTNAAGPDTPLDRWMANHADAIEGN
jgi:hypothetical protein